jgi:signal transduction histidine kinase
LSFRAGHLQSAQLADLIDLQDLRLSLLESTFDSLRSPALLADIFGRVLLINNPMSELGKYAKIDPYQMTVLDIVAGFSSRDPNEIRTSLARVILYEEVVEFPVTISVDTLDRFYVLSVKSIRSIDKGLLVESGLPFSLYGLLVQLRDVSDPVDLINIREQFIEQGMSHIRKRLDSLIIVCSKIDHSIEITGDRNQILDDLVNRKAALEASLEELQSFMGFNTSDESIKYLPTDVQRLFDMARFSRANEAEEKNLTFQIEESAASSLVLAPPKELGEIFSIILSILIGDAIEGTTVSIKISEDDARMSYSLWNTGYGMRDEDLKAYFEQSFQDSPMEYDRLRFLKTVLEESHGTLEYQSKIGDGISFTISLTKSIISP